MYFRTPMDEWSARRRDLYQKTHNTHNRQAPLPPAGSETTILVRERRPTPWTALPVGLSIVLYYKKKLCHWVNLLFSYLFDKESWQLEHS